MTQDDERLLRMTKDTIIKTLTTFNERVDRVVKLSFTERLKAEGFGIQIRWKVDQPTSVQNRFPTEEATDAFINSIRLFIQDNDPISIRNLVELYRSALIPQELAVQINEVREDLNCFLDSTSAYNNQSHREIMKTIIYGDISHTTEQYREVVTQWKTNEVIWGIVYLDFLKTVQNILKFAIWAKGLNQKVIEELQK